MFIKLGIIAVISVGILIAFSSEIKEHFPNTVTNGLESLKLNLNSIGAKLLESTEHRIDSSPQKITDSLSSVGDETLDSAGQTFEYTEQQLNSAAKKLGEELTELKDTPTEFIEENITEKMEFFDAEDVLELIPGT